VDGLSGGCPEAEAWLEGGIDEGCSGDDETWVEGELTVDGSDITDITDGENMDVVEKVGDAVCL